MSFYLFIDGAYFHEGYRDVMQTFYGEVPPINYRELATRLQGAQRVYYYDAVDRGKIGEETSDHQEARIKERDSFHAYLNSLPRWHVREGFVSRGRRVSRRTQKAVDVQLAVDALEHAVAHNMTRAGFILGDLDFEPLLFSLNRFGIETTVWYERKSASPELLEAADVRRQLRIHDYYNLATDSFKNSYLAPIVQLNEPKPQVPLARSGTWNARTIELLREPQNRYFLFVPPGPDPVREPSIRAHYGVQGAAADLERAFLLDEGGSITWST
jgi:uncharacterized LabA/DUF88 family protein